MQGADRDVSCSSASGCCIAPTRHDVRLRPGRRDVDLRVLPSSRAASRTARQCTHRTPGSVPAHPPARALHPRDARAVGAGVHAADVLSMVFGLFPAASTMVGAFMKVTILGVYIPLFDKRPSQRSRPRRRDPRISESREECADFRIARSDSGELIVRWRRRIRAFEAVRLLQGEARACRTDVNANEERTSKAAVRRLSLPVGM